MKKIYTIVIAVIVSTTLFAQAPQKMSYQAIIRDAKGSLVSSHSVGMKISILQGSVTGAVVYAEAQTPTTNANGLVSIEFGGGAGFGSIDWSAGPYFIKTETDPSGGTDYTISGTSQLLSVPYALYAENVNVHVSTAGDTLFLGKGKYVLIPGVSAANYRPITSLTYPQIGKNGSNILSLSDTQYTSESKKTTFSLTAQVPSNATLSIKITAVNFKPDMINVTDSGTFVIPSIKPVWYYDITSPINWSISLFDYKLYTQTFSIVQAGLPCDLRMYFDTGEFLIEYFEDGSNVATRKKYIRVN